MATEVQAGTQSASVNTEHTLGSAISTAGTYQLRVNLKNMALGDRVEMRAKLKLNGSDTLEEAFFHVFDNVQGTKQTLSIPIPVVAGGSLEFSLKQTAGTGRSFLWQIVSL